MNNSYDEIKDLLKKSRTQTPQILKEEEGRELTPQEQKKEESDFNRAVSDRVKFGKIRIYESGGLPKVGVDGGISEGTNGMGLFFRRHCWLLCKW